MRTSYSFIHQYVYIYCIYLNRGPALLFPSGPFSTHPLNKVSFYTRLASIYERSSRSGFLRVLFCAVYSSKIVSNVVALSLGHNGDQCSCETRT